MGSNRREFLKRMGQAMIVAGSSPFIVDVFGSDRSLGPVTASASNAMAPLPAGTPILVLIDLVGGNDSLNTHVPINDSWYYSATHGHGSLAIPAATALPLAGSNFGLHPKLPWLAQRWNKGDVAFVQGVGEAVKSEFSHCAAMEYRNTADFSYSEPFGWLGRYNDLALPNNSVASISLGNLHRSLMGEQTQVLYVRDVQNFKLTVDSKAASNGKFLSSLQAMGDASLETNVGVASEAIADTFSSSASVTSCYNAGYVSGVGQASITWQLVQAAEMIAGGLPCQTYVASMGGYDTHGSQSWMHGDLLSKLDAALSKFFSLIDATNRAADVFVVIQSEFGRQITANSGGGTDHGQASTVIVIGGGVRGGLFGEMPTLDPGGPTKPNRIFDAMKPTVDFRSLYATLLNRLGGDANLTAQVLDGDFENLGIF